jgi:glutathione S-transferase
MQRAQALAIQARFDERVGPAARTALFSALIHEPDYIVDMFARHASTPKRMLYRATFPLAKPLIAKGNGVTSTAQIEAAFEIFTAALQEVEQTVAATGYMVGEQFSVADLTAAALLAPFASVTHVDMARPQPVPERVAMLLARYADHAALDWVRNMYTHHRPPPD